MNRKVLFTICVTTLLASFGSGCISPPTEKNIYYYSIKIVAEQTINYTIYAPFAYEPGTNYSMEQIESHMEIIQGSGQFEIAWTEHGSALKIKSNNTIYLVSEYQDTEEYHPLSLSMLSNRIDNETKEHWIFYNSTGQCELEVYITLEARAGECCGEVRTERTEPEFQMISSDGWQKITILYIIIE